METEFGVCHLDDLENTGHDTTMDRHPKVFMVQLFTKFHIDNCEAF